MDAFSTSDLRKLTAAHPGPCVSIFMPTHAAGRDGQQDALRLKNLLSQAERSLVDQGLRAPEAKELLEPVRDWPAETSFWEKRSQGLAVYVAAGLLNRFRVPLPLDEMVVVNRRFQVKPLLPLIQMYAPEVARETPVVIDLAEKHGVTIKKCLRPAQLPPEVFDYLRPSKRVSYYFIKPEDLPGPDLASAPEPEKKRA